MDDGARDVPAWSGVDWRVSVERGPAVDGLALAPFRPGAAAYGRQRGTRDENRGIPARLWLRSGLVAGRDVISTVRLVTAGPPSAGIWHADVARCCDRAGIGHGVAAHDATEEGGA